MILGLLQEAVDAGASQAEACKILGIDSRTIQRWKRRGIGSDRRAGPRTSPGNKLSDRERQRVLETVCNPELRGKSPKQIVPLLADRGEYIASESTIYRILREEQLLQHRGRASAPTSRPRPAPKVATGPCQVWSWDITYLPTLVRGQFYYLYLIVDVWSRKIVGHAVHDAESGEHAAELASAAYLEHGVPTEVLTLHSDNGSPMKAATMLATLQKLGVVPSFSRPRVSDDNPFSEALFRTVKYCPAYPSKPSESLEAARAWVTGFVDWYNHQHLHSAIRFVTPADRHAGRHLDILERRAAVFADARARHPERWSRDVRNLDPISSVVLHSIPESDQEVTAA